LTPESEGWLVNLTADRGDAGIIIAFGHTLLAMSGEESLAQVYREIEARGEESAEGRGGDRDLFMLLTRGDIFLR